MKLLFELDYDQADAVLLTVLKDHVDTLLSLKASKSCYGPEEEEMLGHLLAVINYWSPPGEPWVPDFEAYK